MATNASENSPVVMHTGMVSAIAIEDGYSTRAEDSELNLVKLFLSLSGTGWCRAIAIENGYSARAKGGAFKITERLAPELQSLDGEREPDDGPGDRGGSR